jgi:hypothetical protein
MATIPFKIRIVKITQGSTQDGIVCYSCLFSSNWAITKEIMADKSKILTKISSNYSLIFSQIDSPSSSFNLFCPNLFKRF